MLLGKLNYTSTGNDIYTQIIDHDTIFPFFGILFTISSISLFSYSKLNNNNFLEELEDVYHKWNMIIWMFNIPLIIIKLII
jgi:hypothetical protein